MPLIGNKMKPRGETLRKTYRFTMIMFFALALGLVFSSTDFGRGVDNLLFDRIAPLLGTPREVNDPLVILIGESDYAAAGTPLGIMGNPILCLCWKGSNSEGRKQSV